MILEVKKEIKGNLVKEKAGQTDINVISSIMKTIHYADIFDYPLTLNELHKFLINQKISKQQLKAIISSKLVPEKVLTHIKKYYILPERESIIKIREYRLILSKNKWKKVLILRSILARVPFIKMISITGSLALNNIREVSDDIDLFIITSNNHLWTSRFIVVVLAKFFEIFRIKICANYFIASNNILIIDQNLYTAREIRNMVPIYGENEFQKFISLNSWINTFFPNFNNQQNLIFYNSNFNKRSFTQKSIEKILKIKIFRRFESFEMDRQIKKLTKISDINSENFFTPDCCKSHIHGHGKRIILEFESRIRSL